MYKDGIQDVYKYGWKNGFWNPSIYNNDSNIYFDIISNFANGILNLSNYVSLTPETAKAYGSYPLSDSNRKYLQGMYPNIGKGLISIAWSGMTKIKVVNNKFEFEYAPMAFGLIH